jgi:type II secretory pathway component PulK
MTTRPQGLSPKSSNAWNSASAEVSARGGSALIVALWVLMILSMLITSLAFDMHIEAGVASYYRKRTKAQYLGQAGVEYAKSVLVKEVQSGEAGDLILEEGDDEETVVAAINLSRGVGVTLTRDLGEGSFTVNIKPEEGRRNVNTLLEEDWKEIFDQAGVPTDVWDELMDCFYDWIDKGDEHRLNGAESEDPFYKERDYEVKNANLDTVDELLMIKGFTEAIVYGGPNPDKDGESMTGIAQWLTTWGEGKVNLNTASREVLLTLPNIEDWVVDDIIAKRVGVDGQSGTKDDGFDNVDEAMGQTGMNPELRERVSTTDRKYIRVDSIGEVQKVKNGITCILQVGDGKVVPVFWAERVLE